MQKPSVRPGRPPRARPTGTPQSEREQNRFRSGTSGLSSTIDRGFGRGIAGTSTRPAPRRPRPEEPAGAPELRTDTDRLVDRPETARERRPDTERRDFDDCDDVRELRLRPLDRELPLPAEPCEPREPREPRPPPPVIPVGVEPTMPLEATTGARPQVSQYSSPPPMSS
ncbi:hypothetical protein GCM10022384_36440 [Streptomyces marokkonensis]|uniref:Uncharacterized protein n=1 Tax=Streptomyces marokkonensis TaxID=324855 RepID=A0ABP7QPC2_9ACTN